MDMQLRNCLVEIDDKYNAIDEADTIRSKTIILFAPLQKYFAVDLPQRKYYPEKTKRHMEKSGHQR